MKYLRLFKENADYQSFLGGEEYVEPHVVVIEGNTTQPLIYKPVYVPPIITFTIEGITYQAEEGMTWGQWVNSEYSNGQYIIASGFISPVNSTVYGIYYMGGFETETRIIQPLVNYDFAAL